MANAENLLWMLLVVTCEFFLPITQNVPTRSPDLSDALLPMQPSDVLDMPVDPNEPTYCLCHQVSYGEMIGCDNPDVSSRGTKCWPIARRVYRIESTEDLKLEFFVASVPSSGSTSPALTSPPSPKENGEEAVNRLRPHSFWYSSFLSRPSGFVRDALKTRRRNKKKYIYDIAVVK